LKYDTISNDRGVLLFDASTLGMLSFKGLVDAGVGFSTHTLGKEQLMNRSTVSFACSAVKRFFCESRHPKNQGRRPLFFEPASKIPVRQTEITPFSSDEEDNNV
jgi:hypothetical protein